MRTLLLALLLTLLLTGCEQKPRQGEAVDLVWAAWGSSALPPLIDWRTPDCPNPFQPDMFEDYAGCHYGRYDPGGIATIAWPASGLFSDSSLAHELLHAAIYYGGDVSGDRGHDRSDLWLRVLDVNAELALRGL